MSKAGNCHKLDDVPSFGLIFIKGPTSDDNLKVELRDVYETPKQSRHADPPQDLPDSSDPAFENCSYRMYILRSVRIIMSCLWA